MKNDRCLIIAEAGVNHNGDVETALKLCEQAKEVGADVVKFQTWKTEKVITKSVSKASYQKANTNGCESQYEMLKRLELTYKDFELIKSFCDSIGISFASTGDTKEDIDFLSSLGVPFFKVGSGEIGNTILLDYIGQKKKPIILSTGMSTLGDVEISINALLGGGAKEITLLHCTTSYPCELKNVNLNAMNTLRDAFKLPVGYSDHTLGAIVATAAVAMGASVIEKHLTLDKNMQGPDHMASANPEEFKDLVSSIRGIEEAMGDGRKVMTSVEEDISKVVLKRIVAKRIIKQGKVITEDDICAKRSNNGLPCNRWNDIVGIIANRDFDIDEGIEF